jgi:hypothetical protein
VIKILDILHTDVLPELKSGSDLANLAEGASLFNYNNKKFWYALETTVVTMLKDDSEEFFERFNLI